MFQPDKPPQKRVGRGYVPQGPTMYHDYHVTLSNMALKGFKNPSYWGRIFGNSMAKLGQLLVQLDSVRGPADWLSEVSVITRDSARNSSPIWFSDINLHKILCFKYIITRHAPSSPIVSTPRSIELSLIVLDKLSFAVTWPGACRNERRRDWVLQPPLVTTNRVQCH